MNLYPFRVSESLFISLREADNRSNNQHNGTTQRGVNDGLSAASQQINIARHAKLTGERHHQQGGPLKDSPASAGKEFATADITAAQ